METTELEKLVIGACIDDNTIIGHVSTIVKPEHFFNVEMGKLLGILIERYREKLPSDSLTLINAFPVMYSRLDIQPKVIAQLVSRIVRVDITTVEEYCKGILDSWKRRELMVGLNHNMSVTEKTDVPTDEVVNSLRTLISKLDNNSSNKKHRTLKELIELQVKNVETVRDKGTLGSTVYTYLKPLDDVFKGFMGGEMIVIAARPGMGKTELALRMAYNNGYNAKKVLFISMEMKDLGLAQRLIKYNYVVEGSLRSNKISDSTLESLKADTVISNMEIYLCSLPAMDTIEMRTICRYYKLKYDIDMIVIDYLQLIKDPKGNTGEEATAMKSKACKEVALENDVPVIALSQLSREVEKRDDKRPIISDIKNSGAIEADADIVMLLWRPEYYGMKTVVGRDGMGYNVENRLYVLVPKFRDGKVNDIALNWNNGRIDYDRHEEAF